MKRYASTAALGLRLTWVRVLGLFAGIGIAQWLIFLKVEGGGESVNAVETLLDGNVGLLGKLGFGMLALVLFFTLTRGKSGKMAYSLRLLRVTEWGVARAWAAVFIGYFLAYWAFELLVALGMFFYHTAWVELGPNALFLAAFRSYFFHYLLPLREPLGWMRMGTVCLSLGWSVSLNAMAHRRQRWSPMCFGILLLIAMGLCLPREMASQMVDGFFLGLAWLFVVLDTYLTWRWMRDEEVD